MVRSGGRFSWKTVASRIWDAVRELMGWGFNEGELDEESRPEDPRVPRILERMDEILDKALEEKNLDKVRLLKRAYGLLGTFLRKIQDTETT
jgi:hypothetical protein